MTLPPADTVPPNPFVGLLRSRKFWMTILDVVVSTTLYYASKYAGANLDDIKFLIAAYQPVVALVIISLAVEDTVRVQSAAKMQVARHEADAAVQTAELAAPLPVAESRGLGGWPPKKLTEQDLPPGRMPDRPIEPRP